MNKYDREEIEYINGSTVIRREEKRYDEERQKDIERIKKSKRDRQLREKLKTKQLKKNMSQIIVAVFVTGMIVMVGDSRVYSAQRQIKDMKKAISSLHSSNEDMKVQIIKISSIDQIKDLSENKLKMVSPTIEDNVYVDMSKNNFSPKDDDTKDNANFMDKIKEFFTF